MPAITSVVSMMTFLAIFFIKDIILNIKKVIVYFMMNEVTIMSEHNNKSSYCIGRYLNEEFRYHTFLNMVDTGKSPLYVVQNGLYNIKFMDNIIHIVKSDEGYTIRSATLNIKYIKLFLDNLYNKYITEENINFFYIPTTEGWFNAIDRKSRNMDNVKLTSDMAHILLDIKQFLLAKHFYDRNGIPFSKGYLIEGKPGTGKTSIVDIIATTHEMPVYEIIFNMNMMDDALFKKLLSEVPPNSIIVIEEMEKQLETIRNNTNINLSEGGILSGLDGPSRLSEGIIVIITVNDTNELTENFLKALVRPGRIDEHYIFNDVFMGYIDK